MRCLSQIGHRIDGSATVEFAIVFPVVMSFLVMGAEFGRTAIQRIALERSMDIAARAVRLGRDSAPRTHDEFRDMVCDNAILLTDCRSRLLLEMRRIDRQTWVFPDQNVDCINLAQNFAPVTWFTIGSENSVMYLRACYLIQPIFPTTTLGLQLPLDASGMFALRTTTGFVTE